LELNERVALADPAAVGAKTTDKLALLPAANVYGKDRPLTLKPAPLTLAVEIVTLDDPEFESVNVWVWVLPTSTLPIFMLEGTLKYPGVGFVAVPERATPTVPSEAFEISDRVALADPAAAGAKITDKLVLVPAANVYGKEMPLTLKPVPLMLAAEIVTLDPPVFDSVKACV
jgi:hypothetical protein